MDLRDRDEPRQGVVANILNLFRNGAVGFIGWLSGWRDWSGRDAGFLRGIQRVLDQFPASILLAYHVATNYGRGPGVGRGLGVGEHLPAHGVGVGVGVGVDVGVDVGVGVAVGVGVGVGVGAGPGM
jgi:hypothetical protein